MDWKAWKMPEGAQPPAKPEGYMEQAKAFLPKQIERLGLPFRPPSKKSNAELAHIGGKFALEQGVFDEYLQRVFQAVWVLDEDIGDAEVLASLAEEMGLDRSSFRLALDSERYRAMVEEDYRLAREKQIWTIPSYMGPNGIIQVHHFEDIPSAEMLEGLFQK